MDIQKEKRRKKRKTTGKLLYGILLGVTLLSIFCCILILISYQKQKEKTVAAMKEIEVLTEEMNARFEEEKKQEELQEELKLSHNEEAQRLLNMVQEMTENGDGMLTLLQALFPDHVVVSGDGRYFFFPIEEHLAKNGFTDSNFTYPVFNEETGKYEGEASYQFSNGTKAKKGVDVSTFQGDIDWDKVKADGIDYAIIRLGFRGYESGKIVLDAKYEDNIKGSLAAGVDTGVYFFTEALTEEEAVEEAEFVIENLQGHAITMPVVIDVEESADPKATRTRDLTQQQRTKNVIAFCERIKEAGYDVMIYGNLNSFMRMMDFEQLEDYDKWFAYYRYPFHFPYKVKMWQYASWEKIDGISGGADVNLMFY